MLDWPTLNLPRLCVVGLLLLTAVSCKGGPLLSGVRVHPTTITPNGDGQDDVALIHYTVGRPAHVSIYLVDEQGQRLDYRRDLRRAPLEGGYQTGFDGVIQGRVLPDGQYRLVVEARGETGEVEQRSATLTIRDADLEPLVISDLFVAPQTFTPNQDGYDDRVHVRLRVNKPARVRLYLQAQDGAVYAIPPVQETDRPGVLLWDYDAGIDFEVPPPPDGDYQLVAEAVDPSGNLASAQAQLAIRDGGIPRAEILECRLERQVVPLGEVLEFRARVSNTGSVPIRTTGPPSGTLYASTETIYALGFPETPGAFRLGLNFDTNPGRPYPWRWQLGMPEQLSPRTQRGELQHYLPPGESLEVLGRVRLVEPLFRDRVYFQIGLMHEEVRLVDFCDQVQVTIGE